MNICKHANLKVKKTLILCYLLCLENDEMLEKLSKVDRSPEVVPYP